MTEELKQVMATAEVWTKEPFDAETRAQVQAMINAEDKTDLIDSFYRTLEFGTGGLRGIMGPGTNRMNKYIVAQATQGYANYMLKVQAQNGFENVQNGQIAVVVGHDCRNNGRLFAETVANIFSANGIKVYLFESLRPTPECSFAIRHLKCQGGVNVTASHNPKEYNGYKAYWEDGSQVLQPHDQGIIDEVNKVRMEDVKWEANPDLIEIIGGEMDYDYMQAVKSVMIDQETILRQKDLNIVYTPMHGAGRQIVPLCLRSWGFENIHVVPEQMVIDGNFPTVVSPNPENAEAMTMGMQLGTKLGADLVIASDPDADRIAIVCRNDKGEWVIINGNQTCMMYCYYIINNMKKLGKMRDDMYRVAQRYAQHHGASTYGDGRDLALNSPYAGQGEEHTKDWRYGDKGYRAAVSKAKEDDCNDDYKGYDTRNQRVHLYLSSVIYRHDGATDNLEFYALILCTALCMLQAAHQSVVGACVAHAIGGLYEDEHSG